MKDFPFYREFEEFQIGFRPFIHYYFNLILFSVCALAAGVIFSVQSGQPLFQETKRAPADDGVSPEVQKRLSVIKDHLVFRFKSPVTFHNFQVKEAGQALEIHFGIAAVFPSGQAQLDFDNENHMLQLAAILLEVAENSRVTIESHTDDSPMLTNTGQYPTNWELSGARAARILRVFAKAGFSRSNLTFVGLGETHPLHPNRDPAGAPISENRLRNRRVVIRIAPIL